jgi:hypothetical protein
VWLYPIQGARVGPLHTIDHIPAFFELSRGHSSLLAANYSRDFDVQATQMPTPELCLEQRFAPIQGQSDAPESLLAARRDGNYGGQYPDC